MTPLEQQIHNTQKTLQQYAQGSTALIAADNLTLDNLSKQIDALQKQINTSSAPSTLPSRHWEPVLQQYQDVYHLIDQVFQQTIKVKQLEVGLTQLILHCEHLKCHAQLSEKIVQVAVDKEVIVFKSFQEPMETHYPLLTAIENQRQHNQEQIEKLHSQIQKFTLPRSRL